jgi:hypothetical protein
MHTKRGMCFDCDKPSPAYMVRHEVWAQAFPDYKETKLQIRKMIGAPIPEADQWKMCLLLCFSCLEHRLGRYLQPKDFDLRLSINAGIRLGMTFAIRREGPSRPMKINALVDGYRTGQMSEGELYGWLVEYLLIQPSEVGSVLTALDVGVREGLLVFLQHLKDGVRLYHHEVVLQPSQELIDRIKAYGATAAKL